MCTRSQKSTKFAPIGRVWVLLFILLSTLGAVIPLTSCDVNCGVAVGSTCTQNDTSTPSSSSTPASSSSSPSSSSPSPQETLEAICDALVNSNAQELYDNLDRKLQQNVTVPALQAGLNANQAINKTKSCQVSNIQQSSPTATGTLTVTNVQGSSVDVEADLVLEEGTWKFSSGDAESFWQQKHRQ